MWLADQVGEAMSTEASSSVHSPTSGTSESAYDTAALALLWTTLYAPEGKIASCRACAARGPFHRVSRRRAYACDRCGTHVYPAAGTPFAGSPAPLSAWLTVLTMIVESPREAAPRRIAEACGLEYRRAWRMSRRIHQVLAAEDEDARLLRGLAASWSALHHSRNPLDGSANTREDNILAAACRIVSARGLEATRIIDIAREAHVSSATIHYHFRSKNDVLLEAFRWAERQLHARLHRLHEADTTPLERVRGILSLRDRKSVV